MAKTDGVNNPGDASPEQKISIPGTVKVSFDRDPIFDVARAIRERNNDDNAVEDERDSIGERQIIEHQNANRIYRNMFWATIITSALTLAALGFNYKALKVAQISADAAQKSAALTDSSIRLSQKNFEVQNKAYLNMSRLSIPPPEKGKLTTFEIQIKNIGKTPATVVSIRIGFVNVLPIEALAYNLEELLSKNMNNLIGPDGIILDKIDLPILEGETWEDFSSGRKLLYFYGEVKYFNLISEKYDVYYFSYNILKTGQFRTDDNHNGIREAPTQDDH